MSGAASPDLEQNRKFIRAMLILGALAFAAAALFYFVTISWTAPIPRDRSTLVIGRDFLDFWINGRAAWAGNAGRLYDPRSLAQAVSLLLGPHYPGQTWAYPPGMLLLTAPFGELAYMPALLVWTVAGFSVFAWSALRHVPDRSAALALIVSPAAVFCLMSGQASFLFASLFLAIFALLDRRPIGAGILIGIISIKPQLGVLFPFMLLAQSRWRTFFSATITTLAIGGIAAAIWGPGIWLDYIHQGMPTGNLILSDPAMIAAPFMPTLFMGMRMAGADYGAAMLVQGSAAVLAAIVLVWACRARRQMDAALLFALFAGCSLCAVPYLLSYDTLPLTAAAMILLASGRLDAPGRRLVQLVYWLPLIEVALGPHHIPGAALIPVAFTAYVAVILIRRPENQFVAAGQPVSRAQDAPVPLNLAAQSSASQVI
jgi:hypothetical protein